MGLHDKLFNAVFSRPENAAAHFEAFLPEELVQALDISRARHEPGSFVDDALAERHTDLLYRIPWRQGAGQQDREVLLFVIFEHQSSVDSLMSYRMLSYAVRVWDKWLQQHPAQKLLPPIVPLVLYHGEQEWTAATELGELFDLEGVKPTAVERLRPFLPRLRIMLNEVGRIPDEELSGHGAVRLTLLLFKHGRRPEVLEHLPRWEDEFRMEVARGKPGLQNLTLLVTYLMTVNEHATVDALAEFLEPMGDAAKEIPMTVGERLIEKGRREGEQKGRQEALLQTARKALAKGMSPEDIAELTELSLAEIQSLTH